MPGAWPRGDKVRGQWSRPWGLKEEVMAVGSEHAGLYLESALLGELTLGTPGRLRTGQPLQGQDGPSCPSARHGEERVWLMLPRLGCTGGEGPVEPCPGAGGEDWAPACVVEAWPTGTGMTARHRPPPAPAMPSWRVPFQGTKCKTKVQEHVLHAHLVKSGELPAVCTGCERPRLCCPPTPTVLPPTFFLW